MKVLTLYMAYFRLPDNFVGGVSDALRLMADYHDKASATSECRPMLPLDSTLSEAFGIMFDEFLEVSKDGKRMTGMVQINDFNPRIEIAQL
jgi:hypothetical protein